MKPNLKVLMLGWELPPNITGGLGMACQGLIRGLGDATNLSLTFAMPQLFGGEMAGAARLIAMSDSIAPRVVEQEVLHQPSEASSKASTSVYTRESLFEVSNFALQMDSLMQQMGDVHIIHAHDWLTFPAAIRLKRRLNCALIAHVHSTEIDRAGEQRNLKIEAIEREGLAAADRVIAVSQRTRGLLVEQYGVSSEKIHVIHNAADHQPFMALERPRIERVVSFIGRITWQKGPGLFVRAASRVARVLPDVQFVMAGEGDRSAMMKTLAAAYGLSARLSFPGFLNAGGVADLLARSSVYVMPSLAEPFGIGALEAIRSGVPVVLSKTCGVVEAIRHVTTVNVGDSVALADAITYLLTHPEIAAQQALSAQQEAAAWSWRGAASAVHDVYRTVADSIFRARTPPPSLALS